MGRHRRDPAPFWRGGPLTLNPGASLGATGILMVVETTGTTAPVGGLSVGVTATVTVTRGILRVHVGTRSVGDPTDTPVTWLASSDLAVTGTSTIVSVQAPVVGQYDQVYIGYSLSDFSAVGTSLAVVDSVAATWTDDYQLWPAANLIRAFPSGTYSLPPGSPDFNAGPIFAGSFRSVSLLAAVTASTSAGSHDMTFSLQGATGYANVLLDRFQYAATTIAQLAHSAGELDVGTATASSPIGASNAIVPFKSASGGGSLSVTGTFLASFVPRDCSSSGTPV